MIDSNYVIETHLKSVLSNPVVHLGQTPVDIDCKEFDITLNDLMIVLRRTFEMLNKSVLITHSTI